MQTPQTFSFSLVFDAYASYIKETENGSSFSATDDAQVVEVYGKEKVKLIEGDYSNTKITIKADLK